MTNRTPTDETTATTAAMGAIPPATQAVLAAETSTYTNRDKWLVLTAAFLGWMFDGLEMGIFPQIARSALGELLAKGASEFDIKWWHQVIDACFLFGAALGGLVFGWRYVALSEP